MLTVFSHTWYRLDFINHVLYILQYQTRCSTDEVAAYGSAGRIVEEALASIRTVRAYGGEDLEVTRYASVSAMSALVMQQCCLHSEKGSYSVNVIY